MHTISRCTPPQWCCLWAIGVLVVGSMAGYTAAEELTADEAVRLALERNATLHAQQAIVTAAEGDLRQARTFPHNPRLEVEGVAGREREATRQTTRALTVKLSQELPLGGKWRQRAQVASAGLDRSRWEAYNAQREVIKEVKETFYRLVFLGEKRLLVEQTADLAQQLVGLTEMRYRVGESPQLDVNLARVEVQQVQRQRLEVLSQLTQARATLNRLLARPPDTLVTVRGTLEAPLQAHDDTLLRAQALQQRPDLRSRQATIEAAQAEVGLARAERVPNLEVGFVFEREETGPSVKQTFGGSLALPLPLWNRNSGAIAAAQAHTRVAEFERTALEQAIAAEIATTTAELQRLQASLQLFRDTILPQSRANLGFLQQAFTAGQVGIVPLVTEQRAFIALSNTYLETRFAYRTTLVTLETLLGGVTP